MNKWWALLTVVVVGAGTIAALELTDTTHFFHDEKTTPVATGSSFNTKGEPKKQSGTDDDEPQGGSNSSASTNPKAVGASANLITPFGNFVSNHRPNLSGSPAPNSLSSVCNTTPGASCTITFNKSGTIKSLPTKIADSNGAAYWDWKLQDIGLMSGTWKIQANASLDGQTKSASDALDLVVGQ